MSSSTSSLDVHGPAPSFSSAFVPAESELVISPGTARTSRPSSSARSAVMSAPLRSRASTTTVAGLRSTVEARTPGYPSIARRAPGTEGPGCTLNLRPSAAQAQAEITRPVTENDRVLGGAILSTLNVSDQPLQRGVNGPLSGVCRSGNFSDHFLKFLRLALDSAPRCSNARVMFGLNVRCRSTPASTFLFEMT
jgi:hypothetical protein